MTFRICIISHYGYGALSGGNSGHIGGVERQTSLLARWLAKRGHEVSFLAWDEGQLGNEIVIDGVRVIRMCRIDAGIPLLRFFHPRWSSLVRGMRIANAELYYHNNAEYVTGQVAFWCRRNRKKFVFSAANDPSCDPSLPEMKTLRERVLYRYGLRHADRLVVQTKRQQNMLRDGFGLDSIPLTMPCPGPGKGDFEPPTRRESSDFRVLWVGRIAPVKRLELLLDVAERIPEIAFDVAGAPSFETDYSRKTLSRARSLRNVTIHGAVPRNRMPEFYKNASLLCCTSVSEGYPNTFLEAWSFGLPIVSTFNPDEILLELKLGEYASDRDGLVDGILGFVHSPEKWQDCSDRVRRHYLQYHEVDSALVRFEQVFRKTIEGNSNTLRTNS